MKKIYRFIFAAVFLLLLAARAELTVFAAASTTDIMKEMAAAFKAQGGGDIRFNFASSGALARQIEAGAPADFFISANVKWMDYLQEKGLIDVPTRVDVVRNALVLAVPEDSSMTFAGFPGNLKGMLAVGNPQSVPAGTYADAALKKLGWFDAVQSHLVKGSSVRTVLMYIERAEVDAGIVYMTDAMQSDKVKVIGEFLGDSHPPVIYPATCMTGSGGGAKAFLAFIQTPEMKAVWEKYGFTPVE
jgi:molybdate transport system substrate-binding protein